MHIAGHERRVDDLGRIHLPKEIRESLEIKEGQRMEIASFNGLIVMSKKDNTEEKPRERILKIVTVKFGERTDKTYDYKYIGKEPVLIGDTVIVTTKYQGETEVKVVDIRCINESEAEYDYETATK